MCLIAFSYKEDPIYKLILLANRDEFFSRPTRPARFDADMLAGKDLQKGGTWLGVSRKGRIAAITNFRNPPNGDQPLMSRGQLASNFLTSNYSPRGYIEYIAPQKDNYSPFNLLLYDGKQLLCYSSTLNKIDQVEPGIHALSNHHIDSNWPKVNRIKHSLSQLLSSKDKRDTEDYLDLMKDSTPATDSQLPKTGVSIEWERKLSPIFISGSEYGTRSTALLLVKQNNEALFTEKSYYPDKEDHITCHESFIFGS